MPNLDKLYEKSASLTAKKDEIRDQLRDVTEQIAALEQEQRNAEAAQALVGREDAESLAATLGLTLPDAD